MKKMLLVGIFAISLFATDYSTMSLDEFLSQKGSVMDSDKEAYRNEMQNRIQNASDGDREKIMNNKNSGQRQKSKDGSCSGSMNKGAKRGGSGMGGRN